MASGDIIDELGLTRLINASGTETVFGASPVSPEVVRAIAAILPHAVDMAELQRLASRTIAEATGAEAGCVTNCTSASITIAAAAAMTGLDLARVEQLPDAAGMKNEIVIQKGHVVNYGSTITGDIRLAGARVIEFGAAFETGLYRLRAALSDATAAAFYVVSHHAAPTGMIPLPLYVEACHARGVPVVVDAAAEYGWRDMLATGADLVLFSVQKALGGPTAGVIAGKRHLVRAAYAQSRGIGRPMKAGKEAVVGTIAALRRSCGATALRHPRDACQRGARRDRQPVHPRPSPDRQCPGRLQRPWPRRRAVAPSTAPHSAFAAGRLRHPPDRCPAARCCRSR